MPFSSIIPALTAVPTPQWAAASRAFQWWPSAGNGLLTPKPSVVSSLFLLAARHHFQPSGGRGSQISLQTEPAALSPIPVGSKTPPLPCGHLCSMPEQSWGTCWASILAEDLSKWFNFCAAWLCSKSQLSTGAERGLKRAVPLCCTTVWNQE